MTGYYDYVLGVIPLALLGITAVLSVVGFPLAMAVPAGGGVAALVIGHALFVNGPVNPTAQSQGPQAPQTPQTPPVNAD
ncbi:hypothetical protein [Halogranum rubrum]|uniref:hypothetical protein n=1 Tax=Halogranum rubrum TaxID=553466 RepID=UPI00067765FC|nr:hypothetical protein [Halogranum salarium]